MLAEKLETAAGRLAELDATVAALEAENRMLGPKVASFQNDVVAAEAAAKARKSELAGLIADVERNRELVAAAADWAVNNAALTEKNQGLAREQVDLEKPHHQPDGGDRLPPVRDLEGDGGHERRRRAERQTANARDAGLPGRSPQADRGHRGLAAERKSVEASLIDVNNRFVPALAAVKTREAQLEKLVKDVSAAQTVNDRLTDQNTTMQARLQRPTPACWRWRARAHGRPASGRVDKLFEKPTVQAALSQN